MQFYLLFVYSAFGHRNGVGTFVGSFSTFKKAEKIGDHMQTAWYHIVDTRNPRRYYARRPYKVRKEMDLLINPEAFQEGWLGEHEILLHPYNP